MVMMDVDRLVEMAPRDALVAQAHGRRFQPDEMVSLAIGWLGARWYSPSLCELAASGWDEPEVATLWAAAFRELGVVAPAVAVPGPAVESVPHVPEVPAVPAPRSPADALVAAS